LTFDEYSESSSSCFNSRKILGFVARVIGDGGLLGVIRVIRVIRVIDRGGVGACGCNLI